LNSQRYGRIRTAIPDNRILLCGGRKIAAGKGFDFCPRPERDAEFKESSRKGGNSQGIAAIITAMSHLEPIIAPAVEAAGYRLVRLRLIGTKRKTLQVMAERADGLMDVEDCARLSRALSELLDAEDPIDGDYDLEVSSPGIDRPLTRVTDYARWAGHEAKLELTAPDESGRKRFKGLLLGLEGNDVVLDAGGTRVKFAYRNIAEAKLVLTDRLIAEDLKARKTPPQ
jgi:ribosome maturation factor RimP